MEKNKRLWKLFTTSIFVIIFFILSFVSSHQSKSVEYFYSQDTVAAREFAPQVEKGRLSVDLYSITSIRFPNYKVTKAVPFVLDSVSSTIDEETIASGNYSATLFLDTIPNKTFYQSVELAAQRDTCWNINKFAYNYVRNDKMGGLYKIMFSKGGQQVFVTHLNSEMVRLSVGQK